MGQCNLIRNASYKINGKLPDASGNITLGAADVGAAAVDFSNVDYAAFVRWVQKEKDKDKASIGFNATAGNNTLHLRSQTAGYDCTIHWGDGSEIIAPANGGNVVHNYATAGLKNITISGNSFAGFYVNYQAGRERYVAVHSMGKWAKDTMTDLSSCFRGCTSLTTLPPDLFRYNTAVTDLSSCFRGCTSLTARDDIFGLDYANRFNGNTVFFYGFMYRDTFNGAQGTAPALWRFVGLILGGGGGGEAGGVFGGTGNNVSSLSNYAEIPELWRVSPGEGH